MSRLDDALRFAIDAHAGMRRKADDMPYVLHPLEVATIAATLTTDEDVLCAAALHDVVEDTPHTLQEVADAFGPRVAAIVASETELKRPDAVGSWLVRKQESLAALRASDDRGIHVLWLSDKLANLRSFVRLHEREGARMWQHFHQSDPQMHAWYYREVLDATRALSGTSAWRECAQLVAQLFGEED